MHSDVSTLRKASIWHEASRIASEEGFRAFWKGNLVTIAHRLPYSSISFYAFERYKNVGTSVPLTICTLEIPCLYQPCNQQYLIQLYFTCHSYYIQFWESKVMGKISVRIFAYDL